MKAMIFRYFLCGAWLTALNGAHEHRSGSLIIIIIIVIIIVKIRVKRTGKRCKKAQCWIRTEEKFIGELTRARGCGRCGKYCIRRVLNKQNFDETAAGNC